MNKSNTEPKKQDEIYCPECGKPVKKNAVWCPHCGAQIKELKISAKLLTPEEEEVEGRAQLGGIIIYNWYVIVALAIGLLAALLTTFIVFLSEKEAAAGIGFSVMWIFIFGIVMAPHIVSLIGIIKRIPYAVPFIRAILIMAMIGFPIHTIIGILLWRRINHPLARKYLNYDT